MNGSAKEVPAIDDTIALKALHFLLYTGVYRNVTAYDQLRGVLAAPPRGGTNLVHVLQQIAHVSGSHAVLPPSVHAASPLSVPLLPSASNRTRVCAPQCLCCIHHLFVPIPRPIPITISLLMSICSRRTV